MNSPTIPAAVPSLQTQLAAAYFAAVLRLSRRRLPLDHSTPPRGLPCVPPPAMGVTS